MRKWFSFAIVLALLVADNRVNATPQLSEPRTVAECLKVVQEHSDRQEEAAQKAGRKPDYRAYQAQAKELAKQYAARFKRQEVRGTDLLSLALLYLEASEPAQARAAIEQRLNEAKLSENDRAEALSTAVVVLTKTSPSVADIKLAEDYTARLDALSDAALKQKIAAHKRLGGYYNGNEIEEDKMLKHDVAVLELVGQLPPAERDIYARQNLSLYGRIATNYGNSGLIEKARETCQQGIAEAVRQKRTGPGYDRCAGLYALFGRPGAALKGTYWINAAPETKQLDFGGRVTLIQFTAHWCVPCRKSYPEILKLHQQFKERGLEIVMSTKLYGYYGVQEDLKPEEEFAANREHYLERYKLPFKIAVEPQVNMSDQTAASDVAWRETNEGKYFVSVFPQHVLLDKRGNVRQMLFGWSSANEARLKKMIVLLLQEK